MNAQQDTNHRQAMRPLTDEELRAVFEKLQTYVGGNISKLIERQDEPYTFRLIKNRVYYLSEHQMRLATNIARENLISLGVKIILKFLFHISQLFYANFRNLFWKIYKIWEISFAYNSFRLWYT